MQIQEDNIKMDLKEIGCGGLDLIVLDQGMDQWGQGLF
jgi:hypothetical protein